MRRVASGLLVACGLASAASWSACGGDAFTTGSSLDRDGAVDSPSAGDDASGPPAAGDDARAEGGADTVDTGADSGGNPASEASLPVNVCPTGPGPAMVLAGAFCIDSTEVTSAQYNDFLLAGPALTGQPSECDWNDSYLPGNGWTFDPSAGTLPIANVNWCDAYAFCAWAGKELCGKVGGGPVDFADFAGADNEHYAACSNASTRIYPYGNTFRPTACNGVDQHMMGVVPVGSLTGCQGGVPGLFDMSGNVEEWQNSCDGTAGASDSCRDGTGAFDYGDPPDGTRCDFADYDARSGQFPDVGLRCCASIR